MTPRPLWIWPAGPSSAARSVVAAGLEGGLTTFVLDRQHAALRRLGRIRTIRIRGKSVLEGSREIGAYLRIEGKRDEARALALAGRHPLVVVEARNWTIIPLENLVAGFPATGAKLFAVTVSAGKVRAMAGILERGVDGVILRTADAGAVRAVAGMARSLGERIPLRPATVTRIRPAGMGDRVCVDTCSLLGPTEGMLVGSQSQCLFLISGETIETEYVAARPFRVNAGAVHAYTKLEDGATRYLSELRSGDEVLLVDSKGRTRPAVVGRLKVERRPLLHVEATLRGRRLHTVVQNAETIRFATARGPVSVSDLRPGHRLLVALERGGRHFGTRVAETVEER